VTTIYFLLVAGERARWHQVDSDELWHFYEGDPLELHTIDPGTWETKCLRLGPPNADASLVQAIAAGCWQAARTSGTYTLAGCTVAPGFEYQDYRILDNGSREAAEVRRRFPELAVFL
jgi:predicted cupin superfamily sugar epimerase